LKEPLSNSKSPVRNLISEAGNHTPVARRAEIDLALVGAAAFFLYLGFGIYLATFNNFAVQVIHIRPDQLGVLESLRESPGLAMAFVLAAAMHIAEPVLGSGALVLIALGLVGYSRTESFMPLVLYSMIWSVGLHCWMPLQSAMTLSLASEGQKGRRLGQVGACAGLGTALGIASVLMLRESVPYSAWYLAASIAVAVGAAVVWLVRRDLSPPDKPRLVFKRKYRLYYGLTFLEGCRKQVFITFAIFALVREYHAHLWVVALLMLINNCVNLVGAPIVGRMIDRIGERRILTVSYSALIFVFLGYALIRHASVLYVLYCLDSLLYLSTIALTTYLSKIADPRDIVPSLSMGVTMNHLAAVAVPVAGGLIWSAVGYRATFLAGAAVVVASLVLARRIGTRPEV